ncbi:Acyl-coenzyme A oxidase [Fusarium keratoplasticum]|nr:Acyl-coenzyme A oxidase [Fusarium keratoplasticum]
MTRPQDWADRLKPASPDGPKSLAAERAGSTVDVDALANHILGAEYLERQERVLAILQKDKIFSKEAQPNLSRPERYMLGLARGKRMRQLQGKYGWSDDEHEMAKYLVDEVSPFQLQNTMFRQTLREQTNDAQKAHWLKRCEDWDIIGAYAQTELGHGSNVQGIETTATWDQATKEFIIHSPSLTAAKWWNGTLGRTANHAIVIAQLILLDPATNGQSTKSFGPHAFVVQVRDLKTHEPLDGIVVGDIGAKFGYASMDNAYMLLHHIRVPHDALLSRYSSVDPETGAYRAPENRAVARKRIVMAARLILARSTTIAIRYCCVRRQFREKGKVQDPDVESPVLDYPTVQIRLFPLLATAFALHYSGKRMSEIYDKTRSDIEDKGDLSALAELHSLSSGLKSLSTELAAGGIETCRRAMGGHGFGGGSGLVGLNYDYVSKPIVEGDNWMITQQMSRYLIKKAKLVASTSGLKPESRTEEVLLRYWHLNSETLQSPRTAKPLDVINNDRDIVEAFEHRASFLAFKAYEAVEVKKASWDSVLVQLHELSNAQSEAVLVYNFFTGLASDTSLPEPTKQVMWKLFRLFGLYTINKSGRDFSRSGAISADQLDHIPDVAVGNLMQDIRPHAVCLVDSFKFPDYLLDSALGRHDGKVYEDLFNRAHRLNPLNRITFNPDYRTDELIMGSGDGGKILAKL